MILVVGVSIAGIVVTTLGLAGMNELEGVSAKGEETGMLREHQQTPGDAEDAWRTEHSGSWERL